MADRCRCGSKTTGGICWRSSVTSDLCTEPTNFLADDPPSLRATTAGPQFQNGQDPSRTLLSRLLPGGAILDVPPVPGAVWGADSDILWAAGQSLIIAGPDGVGKTTLAGNLIQARLGLAKSVLDLPVKPGERNVLVLLMDRPQQAMAALARLFTKHDRAFLNDRVRIWRGPPPQDLARSTGMLAQLCALAGADTCVIDSLKDAALKLSEDETGAGWNQARQYAIEAGTELVELHHPRKSQDGNRKPSKLDDLYGSRWISAGAGSVISLWGQAGDPVVDLTHLKPPVETVGPWQVGIDTVTGKVSIAHGVDLMEQIRLRGANGITAVQAAQLLYGSETPATKEKARRRLDKKVADGLLVCRNGKAGGAHGGVHATWFPAAFTEPFTERSRAGQSDHAPAEAGRSRSAPPLKGGRRDRPPAVPRLRPAAPIAAGPLRLRPPSHVPRDQPGWQANLVLPLRPRRSLPVPVVHPSRRCRRAPSRRRRWSSTRCRVTTLDGERVNAQVRGLIESESDISPRLATPP